MVTLYMHPGVFRMSNLPLTIGRDMPGQRRRVVQEQVRRRGHHPSGNGFPRVLVNGAATDATAAELPQSK